MNKNFNETLKEKAFEVNNLLSSYIRLHDLYLKSAGTFTSLFRKVDFNKLTGEADLIFQDFQENNESLKKLENEQMTREQKEFFDCLCLYTKTLKETVYLLFLMLNALKEKAEGNKLNLKEHMENSEKYKKSIDNYMIHGQRLNNLYSGLF